MKFYPEDYIVEVVVNFTDLNGAAVVPTAVKAVLYDGDDAEVVNFGSLPFDVSEGQKTISIPKEFNRLTDQIRAARILRVAIETEQGTIPRSFSYAIESEQRLVLMENTFLTLEAAEFAAMDTPNTSGWNVATEAQKLAALTESYRRLTMIPMRYQIHRPTAPVGQPSGWRTDWNSIAPRELLEEVVIERDVWDEITLEVFTDFPVAFKKALRRAQFTEANELLQGDTVSKKHRQGIVTETIGESSVTLRAGAIDFGIASETMKALVGYVYFNNRIKRS